MRKFLAFFGPVITVLALTHIEAAVSIKMFTQPWPVRKGLNMISCLEFEKAKELKKKVCRVAYNKYEPDGIHYNFIVGINLCSNSTDMSKFVQWNETMLMSGKYELREGTWFIGIHVVEEDNNTKYFCHARGPKYRESIQIQLFFYAEGNTLITTLVQPTTNRVTEGKKTAEENTLITTLVQPTTNRVTEGKKTAEDEANESDGGNSCSVCAVTGSLSTFAFIVICSILYLCRERLLTFAVHYLFDRQREVDLGSISTDNPSRLSSDDVLDGEEFLSDGNCRALAELCTTSDDIQVKCSDSEATSSATQESYPDSLPHTCTYNLTSSL